VEAVRDGAVWRFGPETGAGEIVSETLAAWAGCVLDEFEVETGFPLAHAWQERTAGLAGVSG
jgi:hypothetical protein